MAKEWGTIPDHLAKFAMDQKIFFIASACGDEDINLSPKGITPLKVIDEKTVAYADYHGSGNQTVKHLSGGGKATLAFFSFGPKPLIVRFYCTGRTLVSGSDEFDSICIAHYPGFDQTKFRQLFLFDVYRVQTSCGFGVPVMEYKGTRSTEPYYEELLLPPD